jgi:hypothetical protein
VCAREREREGVGQFASDLDVLQMKELENWDHEFKSCPEYECTLILWVERLYEAADPQPTEFAIVSRTRCLRNSLESFRPESLTCDS